MEKKDLLKENYDISNMIILNSKKYDTYKGSSYDRARYTIYEIEDKLTDKAKLKIVDSHTDGLGTYLMKLADKYQEDKENGTIKRAGYGSLHKGSLKNWIKKNDTRHILFGIYTKAYASYRLFEHGDEHKLANEAQTSYWGYKPLYCDQPIVRLWFHELLVSLEAQEKVYFNEHDPKFVACEEINKIHDSIADSLWEVIDLVDIFNHNYSNIDAKRAEELVNGLKDMKDYINRKTESLKRVGVK